MAKVRLIIADRGWGRLLYRVLEEVFQIPPLEKVLSGDLEEFFQEWEGVPFRGPEVLYDFRGAPRMIITETSQRIIRLKTVGGNRFKRSLTGCRVELFPEGSLLAAGEIIARLRELETERGDDSGWEGNPFAVIVEGVGEVSVEKYSGPVHKELGRAAWDSGWRKQHPEFSYLWE